MTQDDRMETITDPAEIRATSDERGCCDCRTFDQHERECILPDERTTPTPVGAAVALDLDALHETICDNFTGMAEVRQAADLLVAEVRRLAEENASYADELLTCDREEWRVRAESAEAEVVTLRDTLARRTDSHTQLVRENETLRAKVAEGRRIVGMLAETVVSECEDDPEMCHGHDRTDDGRCPLLVDLNRAHAALAVTTGEGQ